MTIPQLTLLLFALWTLAVPLGAVGVYRWIHIWRGSAAINAFPSDNVQGAGWYQRAMRAHANCVENLPVLGALVLVLSFMGIHSALVNGLSLAILPARALQSSVHILMRQTARVVSVRFSAFLVQYACLFGLGAVALWHWVA